MVILQYAVFDTLVEAILIVDTQGQIQYYNQSFEQLFKNTCSLYNERLSKWIYILNDRTKTIFQYDIDTIIQNKCGRQYEQFLFLINTRGEEIPVRVSISPILNNEKNVMGVILQFRDVTKEYEYHLVNSDYSYASHQLRTPISKALWSLELLLDVTTEIDHKDLIHEANLSLRSVQKLADKMIKISELENDHVLVKKNDIALISFIQNIISEFSLQNPLRSFDFQFVQNVNIQTDKNLLSYILRNILENAVNYSDDTVLTYVHCNNNAVVIEIHDSGIGIPEEIQPLIFTKFFRGSNIDTTNISGSGLGLYLVQQYAGLLHGTIWFRSDPILGTSFFIKIPTV